MFAWPWVVGFCVGGVCSLDLLFDFKLLSLWLIVCTGLFGVGDCIVLCVCFVLCF